MGNKRCGLITVGKYKQGPHDDHENNNTDDVFIFFHTQFPEKTSNDEMVCLCDGESQCAEDGVISGKGKRSEERVLI